MPLLLPLSNAAFGSSAVILILMFPLPPRIIRLSSPVKFIMSIKEKPSVLVLLAMPMADICRAPLNELTLNLPSNRSSVPPPPMIFPKAPFFLSFFNFRLIVFSLLPSSNPVSWAWSLILSYTCTLSIASAGKFFVAILGSLPKNSLPSTNTLLTVWPCAFTVPSFCTCTPGSFFNNCSTLALGCVLNEPALY